jgi:phage tail protein X
MKISTVKSEMTVGALADHVFVNLTPETRKRAEAALIKANPHLADADKLNPGTVVSIPDVPGVKIRAAESDKDPVAEVLNTISTAVGGYQDMLAKRLDLEQADIASQRELLGQKELAAAIKSAPGAAEIATNLKASLAAREKALAEDQKGLKAAFAAIAKDLKSLS